MSIRTALGFVVVLALALPVSAEQASNDATAQTFAEQVPMEIVLRLVGLDSREQLVLGRMPDEVAQMVSLPAAVDVVATTQHGDGDDFNNRIVATARMSKAELREALAASLQGNGWTRPPERTSARRGGFVSSHSSDDWLAFCGADDTYLNGWVKAKGEALTSLTINVYRNRQMSNCDDSWPGGHEAWRQWIEEIVPALEPPEGASVMGMSSGGSDDYQEIEAHVDTELSARDLVDHYASQLVTGGWVAGGTATTSRVAVADVSFEGSEERAVVGFLLSHCGRQEPYSCNVTLMIYRDR